MKQFLCAVAAIALMAPTAAAAQRHNDRHDRQQHSQSKATHQRAQHSQSRQNRQRTQNRNNRPSHATRVNRVQTTRVTRPARTQTRTVYRIGHRPTSFHRIRVSAFRYPRGYSYRRWSIGAILPRLFLSNSYYWNDWAGLGLGAPPPGYVWVRYGPDLLLVNRYTGRIADVIPGAFY